MINFVFVFTCLVARAKEVVSLGGLIVVMGLTKGVIDTLSVWKLETELKDLFSPIFPDRVAPTLTEKKRDQDSNAKEQRRIQRSIKAIKELLKTLT